MGYMDERSFAHQVIATYDAWRTAAEHDNLRAGRRRRIGQKHGKRLFDAAVAHVIEHVGAVTTPYPTAYHAYTETCLTRVWPKTKETVITALTERYCKNRRLPSSDEVRRTSFRELVGEKVYYAIVNSLGGYFELSLVIDTLFAQVLSQALPPPVVAAKSAVRTPAAPAIVAPIRPTPQPVRRPDRVGRSTTKKQSSPDVQLHLPFV